MEIYLDINKSVIISSPAGSGKTTLLAALPLAYPDLPLAWLTLDQDDNEPATFLTASFASLQKLHPALVNNARTLLTGLPDPGLLGGHPCAHQ